MWPRDIIVECYEGTNKVWWDSSESFVNISALSTHLAVVTKLPTMFTALKGVGFISFHPWTMRNKCIGRQVADIMENQKLRQCDNWWETLVIFVKLREGEVQDSFPQSLNGFPVRGAFRIPSRSPLEGKNRKSYVEETHTVLRSLENMATVCSLATEGAALETIGILSLGIFQYWPNPI